MTKLKYWWLRWEYRDCLHKSQNMNEENTVKEIIVHNLLGKMMKCDIELYEKILDTPGFAYYFNELVRLATK